MILFLDFDGVLHPEPCYDLAKLFCYRNVLEDCLRPFPDVHVVITSTWREKYALSHLRFLLGPEVGQRVINVTPSWRDVCDLGDVVPYQRQAEIEAWL